MNLLAPFSLFEKKKNFLRYLSMVGVIVSMASLKAGPMMEDDAKKNDRPSASSSLEQRDRATQATAEKATAASSGNVAIKGDDNVVMNRFSKN